MQKKSFNDKLVSNGDLPKILKVEQKTLLENEGHEVIQKGRKFFVKEYKKVLYTL